MVPSEEGVPNTPPSNSFLDSVLTGFIQIAIIFSFKASFLKEQMAQYSLLAVKDLYFLTKSVQSYSGCV
jgi:hypothetical protein